MSLSRPRLLSRSDDCSLFDSGVGNLDYWLKQRAFKNQLSNAMQTFVTCDNRVVAYYSLASGAVATAEASGNFSRNMPNPIPVIILGRLAVDVAYQRKGLGFALLRDAAQRVIHVANIIGVRGLLVHAISQEARDFYLRAEFSQSPTSPMTLMITTEKLRKAFA